MKLSTLLKDHVPGFTARYVASALWLTRSQESRRRTAALLLEDGKFFASAHAWRRAALAAGAAIRCTPHDPQGYYLLGLVRRHQTRWAEASRSFQRGAKVDVGLSDWLARNTEANRGSGEDRLAMAALLEQPLSAGEKDAALQLIESGHPAGASFPIGWWIALYARMIHHGWPRHAYAAKRRAARITIERAAAQPPVEATGVVELAQALIYDQQLGRAAKLLRGIDVQGWSKSSVRRARQLKAYLVLAGVRARKPIRWPGSLSQADQRFGELIAGKTVAVVGPGATGQKDGAEIDAFEVVVRMNVVDARALEERPNDVGRKTTVCYYNSTAELRQFARIRDFLKSEAVKFAVLRVQPPAERLSDYEAAVDVRTIRPVVRFFGSSPPLAVPRILWDLLQFGPARIKVFNVDFYTGEKRYADSYRTYDFNLSTGLTYHDLFQSYDFAAKLFAAGVFEADQVLTAVLRLGLPDYLSRIDTLFEREAPR